ncbi:carbon-nitrogen hydrolase family protein [Stygiolobus azoricus]|uniref:Carbon-nitrogen hydrolase family protein n=1 Tax=Stygiolobus azoricus TaxID=41675 RepID=A0A650CQ85_9CREN|nr:carbon-nitrogen hydrolase family protein [Stygiolobus azoricus]QGR20000.1 carbon-nitrogen hydrolase family protein [Stygiolobus azoricus]
MKFAIVQPTSTFSAVQLTEEALKAGAEIVLLPEKWTKHLDDVPLVDFQRLAKKYTSYVIPGAVEDGVSVVSPVIDPNGEVKGIAKKIHLYEDEKNRLFPGSSTIIFTYRSVKIGIVICYDVDFPEVIRQMFVKGVEVVLIPSKIPQDGLELWRDYLRVRVLENRLAIVNANALQLPEYPGKSVVYVPVKKGKYVYAEKVVEMGSSENFLVVDINPLHYMDLRVNRLKEYSNFEINEI